MGTALAVTGLGYGTFGDTYTCVRAAMQVALHPCVSMTVSGSVLQVVDGWKGNLGSTMYMPRIEELLRQGKMRVVLLVLPLLLLVQCYRCSLPPCPSPRSSTPCLLPACLPPSLLTCLPPAFL